ncbi:MAG: serine/threonine-protein kinase, partial [Planctomycetota bacterium]
KSLPEVMVAQGLLSPAQVRGLIAAMKSATPPKSPGPPTPVPQGGAPGAKPAAGPNPAEPIPGYQIVGKLGAGGMATVFKAIDRKNGDREVALKILYPHHAKNELFLRRFLRESELLTKFDHPNIVKGYAHGSNGPLHWLVMELLAGKSVQSLLDETGRLKESEALEIIVQIAKALEYMEGQGIVHRDIKPDNIIMQEGGAIKLIDLGFAKAIGESETEQDVTCGTPQYMSPEQAQGRAELDVRSDIYSLGATLYHLVLGEVPFGGSDNMEIMAQQVLAELKTSKVKGGAISKHMHFFIEKMMAKEVEIRYQTPHEAIEDIESQMEGLRTLEFNPDDATSSAMDALTGGKQGQPMRPQSKSTERRMRPQGGIPGRRKDEGPPPGLGRLRRR